MSQLTFVDVLLNVILPLVVAGVVSWLFARPNAPIDPEYKGAIRWVILVVVVVWILYWLVRVLRHA